MRSPLTESVLEQLRLLTLLHKLGGAGLRLHGALLEGDEAMLDTLVSQGMAADLWEVAEDGYLQLTQSGSSAYHKLLQRQQAYLIHLDLFCAVDLTEGVFGDASSRDLYGSNYSDLRIAVAEYKGINPYKMVFLAMLADGTWFEETDWKTELALSTEWSKELEEIVRAQITMDELGYQDQDGQWIDGEAVLQDVILQGAEENLRRLRETEHGEGRNGYVDVTDWEETTEYEQPTIAESQPAYDPWATMHEYTSDPHYAEPLWLEENWLQ